MILLRYQEISQNNLLPRNYQDPISPVIRLPYPGAWYSSSVPVTVQCISSWCHNVNVITPHYWVQCHNVNVITEIADSVLYHHYLTIILPSTGQVGDTATNTPPPLTALSQSSPHLEFSQTVLTVTWIFSSWSPRLSPSHYITIFGKDWKNTLLIIFHCSFLLCSFLFQIKWKWRFLIGNDLCTFFQVLSPCQVLSWCGDNFSASSRQIKVYSATDRDLSWTRFSWRGGKYHWLQSDRSRHHLQFPLSCCWIRSALNSN